VSVSDTGSISPFKRTQRYRKAYTQRFTW